jgi:excisionase family DNA binding protein
MEDDMEVYLTIEELAAMLKLAEQTIRRYVLNRVIPYHKIRTAIRFRLSEIEKWIDGGCTDNVEDLLCGEKADEADDDLPHETADSSNIDEGNKEIE